MNKTLFPAILIILFAVNAVAQSAAGRYASRLTQDGTVFFFMPQKLSQLENINRFEYDMTSLTWSDSITVNFTFVSKTSLPPTGLKIVSGNTTYDCQAFSPLYIDIIKKGFEVRITSKFPSDAIKNIIQCTEPPEFHFSQGSTQAKAAYSAKAWNKDRKKLNDIFSLIKYTTPQ